MRKKLEAQLRHPVISFAYPFGSQPAYDEQGDYVLRSIVAAGTGLPAPPPEAPTSSTRLKNR